MMVASGGVGSFKASSSQVLERLEGDQKEEYLGGSMYILFNGLN